MINVFEVRETNKMIEESNLDVRTITMGISLLDCCDNNVDVVCEKIYRKITEKAANLVSRLSWIMVFRLSISEFP